MHSGDYSDIEWSMHEDEHAQSDTSLHCSPTTSALTIEAGEWNQANSRHNKKKQQQPSNVEDNSKKSDVGQHVDATACFPVKKFFQWRDHEWTSQTKNSQRGYGVGRSVLWVGD